MERNFAISHFTLSHMFGAHGPQIIHNAKKTDRQIKQSNKSHYKKTKRHDKLCICSLDIFLLYYT